MYLARLALCLSLCSCSTLTIEQHQIIAQRWHRYVPDKGDVWSPTLRGDCEDYALAMRERVGGQLLYVRTEQGQPHIVLDVNGKIIDNLSRKVYPRSEMKHKLIFEMTDEHVEQFLKARDKR